MKKYLLIITGFFLFTSFSSNAQTAQQDSVWIVTHYHKMEQMIPMRDGIKLFTSIYIPNDISEKHPILMRRTPYSCSPYGIDKFAQWWNSAYKAYFKEGYIMVTQDVRGKFMSEGTFEDIRPFNPNKKSKKDCDESTDAYDAIDWLVKNVPNNNGNVGVFGISYPGFYTTMAALSNHPALKAVSPQAPCTDWFIGDDTHHKGAFFLMDEFDFDRDFELPQRKPYSVWPTAPEINRDDNYNFFLGLGSLKNITKQYFGDTMKYWDDIMNHPNYDSFWRERNARKYLANVKPAMLVVGGLFDAEDCYGAWNAFKTNEATSPRAVNSIVMGPWFHGGWSRSGGDRLGNVYFGSRTSDFYQQHFELPFFNHYLKGVEYKSGIGKANIFISGENNWYQFTSWPPSGTSAQLIYLDEKNKISLTPPAGKESYDEYTSDPSKPVPYAQDVHWDRTREYMCDDQRFAARRPDVLVYQTDVFDHDVTLTGPITADLFVSLSTTDADFVVKVIDVFPDDFKYPDSVKINYPMGGYQMLVRAEIMRGRYRNSFEKPEAFVPGEVTEVKYELPDIAHTFKKGHKVMVQVQSSWFPLVDRNPQQFIDIYKCDDKDFVKSDIKIYHDVTHPSKLVIPVLPK